MPIQFPLGTWEVHNKGFASDFMRKHGYGGGGIGKHENGIIHPVEAESKVHFNLEDKPIKHKEETTRVQLPDEPLNVHPWPENTILVTGDSMLHGVNGNKMSKKYNVKVRPHSGATVRDMYDHLNALLRKKPKILFLHIGANDAPNKDKTASMIVEEIKHLKKFAEAKVPGLRVVLSCPIVRRDDDTANIKVIHVRHMLKTSGLDIITHNNIGYDYLGGKGLHLVNKGIVRLATNMIDFIKRL